MENIIELLQFYIIKKDIASLIMMLNELRAKFKNAGILYNNDGDKYYIRSSISEEAFEKIIAKISFIRKEII